jgi:hypothetical protein
VEPHWLSTHVPLSQMCTALVGIADPAEVQGRWQCHSTEARPEQHYDLVSISESISAKQTYECNVDDKDCAMTLLQRIYLPLQ